MTRRRGRRIRHGTRHVAPLHGLVVASFRRHFAVRADDGETIDCVLKGRRLALACGDRVRVTRIDGGGAIEASCRARTLFYRSDAFKEKLIAANVTQVIGVVAPDLGVDEELINRWIIAAEAERCRLVLVANKADQPGFDDVAASASRRSRRSAIPSSRCPRSCDASPLRAVARRPDARC